MKGLKVLACVLIFFFIFGCIVAYSVAESNEWVGFKRAHNCKVVGEMSGDIMLGNSTSGSLIITSTPDKQGWLCDDGVTYWRNK